MGRIFPVYYRDPRHGARCTQSNDYYTVQKRLPHKGLFGFT
jgi:hypothetical protein